MVILWVVQKGELKNVVAMHLGKPIPLSVAGSGRSWQFLSQLHAESAWDCPPSCTAYIHHNNSLHSKLIKNWWKYCLNVNHFDLVVDVGGFKPHLNWRLQYGMIMWQWIWKYSSWESFCWLENKASVLASFQSFLLVFKIRFELPSTVGKWKRHCYSKGHENKI